MTDLRALLGDRYGIRTPAQLAHVLSEKLDDAAPLNVTRRWLPLAEQLWERISLPDLPAEVVRQKADAWDECHQAIAADPYCRTGQCDCPPNPYRGQDRT